MYSSQKNSDYFLEEHSQVALCYVDSDCLLCGRNGIFKILSRDIRMDYS